MLRRKSDVTPESPELVLTNCMMLGDRASLAIRNIIPCTEIAKHAQRLVVLMEAAVELIRSNMQPPPSAALFEPLSAVINATKHGLRFVNKSLKHGRRGSVKDDKPGKEDDALARLASASLHLAQALNTILLQGSPRADGVVWSRGTFAAQRPPPLEKKKVDDDGGGASAAEAEAVSPEAAAQRALFASARCAIAVRDRRAERSEELPLTEGEIVAIVPKMAEMYWWTARTSCGKVGPVPIDAVLVAHPITRFVRIGGRNVNDWFKMMVSRTQQADPGPSHAAAADLEARRSSRVRGNSGDAAGDDAMGAGDSHAAPDTRADGSINHNPTSAAATAATAAAAAATAATTTAAATASPMTPHRQGSTQVPAHRRHIGSESGGMMAGLSRSPSIVDAEQIKVLSSPGSTPRTTSPLASARSTAGARRPSDPNVSAAVAVAQAASAGSAASSPRVAASTSAGSAHAPTPTSARGSKLAPAAAQSAAAGTTAASTTGTAAADTAAGGPGRGDAGDDPPAASAAATRNGLSSPAAAMEEFGRVIADRSAEGRVRAGSEIRDSADPAVAVSPSRPEAATRRRSSVSARLRAGSDDPGKDATAQDRGEDEDARDTNQKQPEADATVAAAAAAPAVAAAASSQAAPPLGRPSEHLLQRPLPPRPVSASIPVVPADVQPFYADGAHKHKDIGDEKPKGVRKWLRRSSKEKKEDNASLLSS